MKDDTDYIIIIIKEKLITHGKKKQTIFYILLLTNANNNNKTVELYRVRSAGRVRSGIMRYQKTIYFLILYTIQCKNV